MFPQLFDASHAYVVHASLPGRDITVRNFVDGSHQANPLNTTIRGDDQPCRTLSVCVQVGMRTLSNVSSLPSPLD